MPKNKKFKKVLKNMSRDVCQMAMCIRSANEIKLMIKRKKKTYLKSINKHKRPTKV